MAGTQRAKKSGRRYARGMSRGRGVHVRSRMSQFNFQTANFNSQVFQTAMRHHPYCLARPRVGPSSRCLPSKMRGMARQGAQPLFLMCPHSLSEIRGAARRATRTSLRTSGVYLRASSLRRRAALFVAARENTERPPSAKLLAGGSYWPPGGAPAPPGCVPCGARPRAPHPIPPRMTPHESAPRWTGRIGLYSI